MKERHRENVCMIGAVDSELLYSTPLCMSSRRPPGGGVMRIARTKRQKGMCQAVPGARRAASVSGAQRANWSLQGNRRGGAGRASGPKGYQGCAPKARSRTSSRPRAASCGALCFQSRARPNKHVIETWHYRIKYVHCSFCFAPPRRRENERVKPDLSLIANPPVHA